ERGATLYECSCLSGCADCLLPARLADFVQVFDILITAEDSNSSFHPEILFLNGSGFTLAKVGDAATLYCHILLLGDSAEPRYTMRWEASRYGDLTVAQMDQSLDDGPYIHPAYQDRLSLVSHGPESLLHFDPVQEQDFGEYLCKGQVVGQEGETFTSLSILAEDTRPELESPVSEGTNATVAPEVISLNSSGRVSARLGQRAELECRIESGQPGVARYAVEWGSAAGDVVLSRVDQADPGANYLDPGYRQRLTVSFLGTSARLIFHAVRQEDYREYFCRAWVSGHPEHSLTASTSL
ncbi:hypothetical protein chiPu_0023942, partial [Chiloscyllium punctatum]|nr:hypothetical protein [Chiloscyllium punctatum]